MLSLPSGAVEDSIQAEHSNVESVSEKVLTGQGVHDPTPVEDLLVPGKQGVHAKPFSAASYPARHSQLVMSTLASGDEVLAGQLLHASSLSAMVETPLKVSTGHAKQESVCP